MSARHVAKERRCTCCELPESMCGRAAEQRLDAQQAHERAMLLARPGWFEAKFPGRCCHCGEWFQVGTPISRRRWAAGQSPIYAGECCAGECS